MVSFAQRIMFEHVTVQSFHRIAVRKSKKVVNNVVQINRTNDSIGISKPWPKQRELHKRQTATAEAAAFDTNRINNHTTSLAHRRHAPTVNMLAILYIISESGE